MRVTSSVVNERVLTDDILHVANEGYRFKGGYAAVLEYHTYLNPWSDQQHVRRFRTIEAAERFIAKRYGTESTDGHEEV